MPSTIEITGEIRRTLGSMLTLKRGAKNDMVEVFMDDEFIGTLFRDDEEGEVSYAFNMAILEFDLPTI